jgi:hypothetical protein
LLTSVSCPARFLSTILYGEQPSVNCGSPRSCFSCCRTNLATVENPEASSYPLEESVPVTVSAEFKASLRIGVKISPVALIFSVCDLLWSLQSHFTSKCTAPIPWIACKLPTRNHRFEAGVILSAIEAVRRSNSAEVPSDSVSELWRAD